MLDEQLFAALELRKLAPFGVTSAAPYSSSSQQRRRSPMWLATPLGFVSVVQKPGDDHLTIRARAHDDLDRLREHACPSLTPTITGAGTDYPYRATCSHEAWATALADIARAIDYSNFKSTVSRRQGHARARVYGQVWHQLLAIEREETR
jgi:hypothetical protein